MNYLCGFFRKRAALTELNRLRDQYADTARELALIGHYQTYFSAAKKRAMKKTRQKSSDCDVLFLNK